MTKTACRQLGLAAIVLLLVGLGAACAQGLHHPFAVGANEGVVGRESGFGAWLLAQQSHFYQGLTGAIRAARESWAGKALLVGLSLAYGVLHAAGPGHGKAVLTSYLVSNERALRRGIVLAGLAALLQATIAVAIVGAAVLVFHATAARITAAAQTAELTSYLGIVALGLFLLWRKGRALWHVLRPLPRPAPLVLAPAGPGGADFGMMLRESSRFVAQSDPASAHGPDCTCGHAHFPDPALVSQPRFDLRAAALAVVSAGARPCSGAILVLVFAAAQGLFGIGVASAYTMALGTAFTTAVLAAIAVLAKDLAERLAARRVGRGSAVLGRTIEFAAAACVFLFGVVLLAANFAGTPGGS